MVGDAPGTDPLPTMPGSVSVSGSESASVQATGTAHVHTAPSLLAAEYTENTRGSPPAAEPAPCHHVSCVAVAGAVAGSGVSAGNRPASALARSEGAGYLLNVPSSLNGSASRRVTHLLLKSWRVLGRCSL